MENESYIPRKMYSPTKAKIERLAKPFIDELNIDSSLPGLREQEIDKILSRTCKSIGWEVSSYYAIGKCPFY